MTQPVQLELGRIARLTLNRPDQRNAMTVEMGDVISSMVGEINSDPSVRVLLIEGAGRSFSAGGDFDVLEANASRPPEDNRIGMLAFYKRFLSILHVRVPTVAVVHGAAVGAGLCFAMACDIRLAAEEAKLGANFVRVGLHPGMGCSLLMPRLIGAAKARELMLTGRLIAGREAEAIGLVNASVPRQELPELVSNLSEEIASAAPLAVQQTKASLLAPLLREVEEALGREAACQAITFTSSDLREAVRAFRAGEKPTFQGK